MAKPVTDWLIFIGGFMQDRSLATYGMCGMAHEARDRYTPGGVLVDYEPWKCDWKSTAEWIYRWSKYDAYRPNGVAAPPTIMVAAYSWGAGWGLVQLAAHLADRGLEIQVAVASDAVRHVGWTWSHSLGLSQVLAYWPWWKLHKPESITNLHWFRQERRRGLRGLVSDRMRGTTWLYGHEWVDADGAVSPNGTGVPRVSHTNMDDCYPFRQRVFQLADQLFLEKAA